MNLDILNKRYNELLQHKSQLEFQTISLEGHLQEVRYLIQEITKPAQESQDGQANIEATEQPSSEGLCDAQGEEVPN